MKEDSYRLLKENETLPTGTIYEYKPDQKSELSWALTTWDNYTRMSKGWEGSVRVHKDHDPEYKQDDGVVWRKLCRKRFGDLTMNAR